jgi:hypothetical protein
MRKQTGLAILLAGLATTSLVTSAYISKDKEKLNLGDYVHAGLCVGAILSSKKYFASQEDNYNHFRS